MDRQLQLLGLSAMIFMALRSLVVIPRLLVRKNLKDDGGEEYSLRGKPFKFMGLMVLETVFGAAAWAGVILWMIKLV